MTAAVIANGFEVRIEGGAIACQRQLLEFAAEVATDEDRPGAVSRLRAFDLAEHAAGLRGVADELPRWSWRRRRLHWRARLLDRELRRPC